MDYRLKTDIEAGYIASTAEFAGMECHVMLEPYDIPNVSHVWKMD